MTCDEASALIDAFAEDALDGAERASVAEHVAACERCGPAAAASRRLSVALATLPGSEPSSAADARILAAVAEERAWAQWRARTRRVVVASGVAAAAGAVVVAVFVATPAARWLADHTPDLLRIGEAWLRLRAAPALGEARGTLVAALTVLVAVAMLERAAARRQVTPHRSR